jgi:hypothetical protein
MYLQQYKTNSLISPTPARQYTNAVFGDLRRNKLKIIAGTPSGTEGGSICGGESS